MCGFFFFSAAQLYEIRRNAAVLFYFFFIEIFIRTYRFLVDQNDLTIYFQTNAPALAIRRTNDETVNLILFIVKIENASVLFEG